MKILILQENLSKGLATVSRIAGLKSNLPILTNVLFSVQEGNLKLTTTNLEIGINVWLPAKKEKKGELTVPVKDLSEFVSTLSSAKISLEKEEEKLLLLSGKQRAVFNGVSAVEFPQVPSLKDKKTLSQVSQKIKLKADEFVQAVEKVCFAAAVDEARPTLTGVRLSSAGKTLQLVATDGYRLSLERLKTETEIKLPSLIIPARALMEVAKLVASSEAERKELLMAVVKEESQVIFSFNETEVIARLIEGEFPDFEKIIPEEEGNQFLIDREEFEKAIRAASIFARKSANIIRLKFTDEELVIKANAPEVGENEARLEVENKGEEIEIAFNCRFLQDFLKSFSQENFILELFDPLKPGLFKGEKDSSFFHIIMPVRIQK